ncbi:hypothetical protein BDN67DRAFT_52935 [Paxillus ammoniavirescens]|nr:hypothetical protein BDN67DRAFT_52935 [Paxillus ammoniavirescens]
MFNVSTLSTRRRSTTHGVTSQALAYITNNRVKMRAETDLSLALHFLADMKAVGSFTAVCNKADGLWMHEVCTSSDCLRWVFSCSLLATSCKVPPNLRSLGGAASTSSVKNDHHEETMRHDLLGFGRGGTFCRRKHYGDTCSVSRGTMYRIRFIR